MCSLHLCALLMPVLSIFWTNAPRQWRCLFHHQFDSLLVLWFVSCEGAVAHLWLPPFVWVKPLSCWLACLCSLLWCGVPDSIGMDTVV